MRRTIFVVVTCLVLATAAFAADQTPRLQGIAFTEGAAKEIQAQVWALGEQVEANPDWQFEPVFAGSVIPGKAFSIDLGEARLPVRVELAAEGHVAVTLEVVLPEQLELPAAWLRHGGKLEVRVTRGGKPAADAVVWGRIVAARSTFDPWRWETSIPRTSVSASGSVAAVVPDEAS
jgi:hypothetical protein